MDAPRVTLDQRRDEAAARQRLSGLEALETAWADPVRLASLVHGAADREDAVRVVATGFGLTPEQASVVLDNQFGRLTASSRAALAEELRVLRVPWGEPVELWLRAHGRRSAVLDLEGTEHRFRAGGRHGLLEAVTSFLLDHVARPRLRPVLVRTDLTGGPTTITVWPSGNAAYGYPDDPEG
jgi:hypothetical protein